MKEEQCKRGGRLEYYYRTMRQLKIVPMLEVHEHLEFSHKLLLACQKMPR